MPRDEQRPIRWKLHAEERLIERGVAKADAESIVRTGSWHADGESKQGEPKWAAEGSVSGQHLRVVFVETAQSGIEILFVITVIPGTNRRR